MTCYGDVIDRWLARTMFGSTEKQVRTERVFAEGDVVYSYGTHFEMIRALRDRKNELRGFLLNGDVYSTSTSRHQSTARGCVERAVYGTTQRSVIIPYSALGAAGIDPADVEIIDVTADTYTEKVEEHYELPPNAFFEWVEQREYREPFPEEKRERLAQDLADRTGEWEGEQRSAERARAGGYDRYPGLKPRMLGLWLVKRPKLRTWAEYVNDAGSQWSRQQRNSVYAVTHYQRVCYVDRRRAQEWEFEYLPDGRTRYWRTHRRHWLGESLIRAEIRWGARVRCPECKGRPMLGPAHRVWTERDDVGWMRPEYTSYEFSYSQADDRMPHHTCRTCLGAGTVVRRRKRKAYFLSGFDHQEARRSYFFCELPKGAEPTTVEEAYEALKPDPVSLAEAMGRDVVRQGDIFAIPTARTKRELIAAGGTHERMGSLLGTNHAATEVIEVAGVQYARGILHHVPAGRAPDHARQRMGDLWHLIVKNTVPLAA